MNQLVIRRTFERNELLVIGRESMLSFLNRLSLFNQPAEFIMPVVLSKHPQILRPGLKRKAESDKVPYTPNTVLTTIPELIEKIPTLRYFKQGSTVYFVQRLKGGASGRGFHLKLLDRIAPKGMRLFTKGQWGPNISMDVSLTSAEHTDLTVKFVGALVDYIAPRLNKFFSPNSLAVYKSGDTKQLLYANFLSQFGECDWRLKVNMIKDDSSYLNGFPDVTIFDSDNSELYPAEETEYTDRTEVTNLIGQNSTNDVIVDLIGVTVVGSNWSLLARVKQVRRCTVTDPWTPDFTRHTNLFGLATVDEEEEDLTGEENGGGLMDDPHPENPDLNIPPLQRQYTVEEEKEIDIVDVGEVPRSKRVKKA